MEHLLFTGAPAPIVFPYLCTEDWDGGDFLTYPQRKGWEIPPWDAWDRSLEFDTAGRTFDEIAAFLQTWLFFGLLESVLGIKIPKEDFTRLNEDGKDGKQAVITTTRLKHYLEEWRSRISRVSEVERKRQEVVIWDYISQAVSVNKYLHYGFSTKDISESGPLVKSVLCQTLLEHALRRALDDILPITDWSMLDTCSMQKLLRVKMVAAGWCPYTVEFLEIELQADAQAFIFSLNSLRAQEDHGPCKSAGFDQIGRQCVADQIDRAAPSKTKHVTADCECQYVGPPTQELIDLIEEGWTPIMAIATSDSTDEIEILVNGVQFASDIDFCTYFALSHVWTDGLGNHEQNTLPTCQIRRLAAFLHSAGDTEFGREMKPETDPSRPDRRVTVDFWLDTLCIPVQPQFQEHRDRCIGQMHSIYRMAIGVIVLDPDLQQITNLSKPIEIVARLLASLWRTRLWTYQEGALAHDLYLPGQNCMHSLYQLQTVISAVADFDGWFEELGLPSRNERDLVEYQVARSLMISYCKTIKYPGARASTKHDLEDAFHLIIQAMYQRSTGRPDDETVCIATFLGLDPLPLLDTPPQHRMTRLLQIVPCIPRSALFTWGPRQKAAGFRWAPLTFLAPHGIKDPVICSSSYAPDPAEPKATVPVPASFLHPRGLGLAVFFSGIRFTCRPEVPTPEIFSVVTSIGKSYLIESCETDLDQSWEEISPENFAYSAAILFSRPNSHKTKNALLVEMLGQETEEGYPLCRWRCLVEADDLDRIDLAGKTAEDVQKHQFTGEYIPGQWWVLD
jgi:hypothetical protein